MGYVILYTTLLAPTLVSVHLPRIYLCISRGRPFPFQFKFSIGMWIRNGTEIARAGYDVICIPAMRRAVMLAAEKIYGAAIEAVSPYRLVTSAVSFNPADKTLAVSGRSLQVDRCASSSLHTSFSVLCVHVVAFAVCCSISVCRSSKVQRYVCFPRVYCVIVEYSVLYTFMGHEKVFEFCGTTTVLVRAWPDSCKKRSLFHESGHALTTTVPGGLQSICRLFHTFALWLLLL